jgi:hypothetical protein
MFCAPIFSMLRLQLFAAWRFNKGNLHCRREPLALIGRLLINVIPIWRMGAPYQPQDRRDWGHNELLQEDLARPGAKDTL